MVGIDPQTLIGGYCYECSSQLYRNLARGHHSKDKRRINCKPGSRDGVFNVKALHLKAWKMCRNMDLAAGRQNNIRGTTSVSMDVSVLIDKFLLAFSHSEAIRRICDRMVVKDLTHASEHMHKRGNVTVDCMWRLCS